MPKTKTLLVRAKHADRPCPKLRKSVRPNRHTGRDDTLIYHDETVEVPNERYYRRRIIKGDLVEVDNKPAPAKAAKRTAKAEG